MKISTDHGYDTDFIPTDNQVTNTLNKFRNHLCIVMIKIKKKNDQTFSFNFAKVFPKSDILTNKNSDYFGEYFYKNVTNCISKSIILSGLTLADVPSVYKKKSKNSKENYESVSILSSVSKIYERCIYDEIQLFFASILSKYPSGFRGGYNMQHC